MSQTSKEANRERIITDKNYVGTPNFVCFSDLVAKKPTGSYVIKRHHVEDAIRIQQAEFEIQVIDYDGMPQSVPLAPVEGGFAIPGTTKVYESLESLISALKNYKYESVSTRIPESKEIEANRQKILKDERFINCTYDQAHNAILYGRQGRRPIIRPVNALLTEFEIQFIKGKPGYGIWWSEKFRPVEGGFMLSDSDSTLTHPSFFNVHESLELMIERLKNYDQYLAECCRDEIFKHPNYRGWNIQEAEKYILNSKEGSYVIVPNYSPPETYKIYYNDGGNIEVIMLRPSSTGSGFESIPSELGYHYFRTLPDFFKHFGIGVKEVDKKPKEAKDEKEVKEKELTYRDKEKMHDQEIRDQQNFKGLKELFSLSGSGPLDINHAAKFDKDRKEREQKAQQELLSKSQAPYLIVPDTHYSGAYNIIRFGRDKRSVQSTLVCATENGFALCDFEFDNYFHHFRLKITRNFSTMRELLRTLDLLTPEERKEDEKKITEALRHSENPPFKDINAPEAAEELDKATQETSILIPAPNGFILLGRIPPFPITSTIIDISKENATPGSSWFQAPHGTLKRLQEILLSDQRKMHNSLLEIKGNENYRNMELKKAEEELRTLTGENYRIIPGASPTQFNFVYRIEPLEPIVKTFDVSEKVNINKLKKDMREQEGPKARLINVKSHPSFKPTLTHKDAEEQLDMTFSEKTIIVPNPDGSYECFVRVPPLTTHKTYDPKETRSDLIAFLNKIGDDLRNEIKKKREAINADQKPLQERKAAADTEGSIRKLTGVQFGLLKVVREKYGPKLREKGGIDAVIKEFQGFLERKYNEHFAGLLNLLERRFKELEGYKKELEALKKTGKEQEKIQDLENTIRLIESQKRNYDHAKSQKHLAEIFATKKLPLKYDAKYNHPFIQQAYLLNPYHTTWRYFLKPNPWIDPKAPYAVSFEDPETGEPISTHASITPESMQDLALLWLAASDKSIKPINDFTTEGMMESFTHAILVIARAHNWDELDAIKEGPEKQKIRSEMLTEWGQYVDNLRLDNPSCPIGVNQRLMDSILGNPIADRPETRRLDPQVIRDSFQGLLGTQFEKYFNAQLQNQEKAGTNIKANLESQIEFIKQVRAWFETRYVMYENLPPEQQKFFDDFRLESKDIKAVLKDLKPKFGERFEWLEMRVDAEHYSSAAHYFEALAKTPDPWTLAASARLDEIMKEKLEHLEKALKAEIEAEQMRALISAHREEVKVKREKKEREVTAPLPKPFVLPRFDIERKDRDKEKGKGPKPKTPKSGKT